MTAHTWEQGKNEHSHQDSNFAEVMLGEPIPFSRVLFPADFNTVAAVTVRLSDTHRLSTMRYFTGASPKWPLRGGMGPYLRAALWNIERGSAQRLPQSQRQNTSPEGLLRLVRQALGGSDPHDPSGRYWLAPHDGRMLRCSNEALPRQISDHHPITVDLPLMQWVEGGPECQ